MRRKKNPPQTPRRGRWDRQQVHDAFAQLRRNEAERRKTEPGSVEETLWGTRKEHPPMYNIEIIFDGGFNKKDRAYGSFILRSGKEALPVERRVYSGRQTSQTAEWRTLLAALQFCVDQLIAEDLPETRLIIRGDSKLVLCQLCQIWKCRNRGLQPLQAEGIALVGRFHSYKCIWWPRANSVRWLGH